MKKNFRTGPRHSPPGMPKEGFPPDYIPQTPEESAYLKKEWTGIVMTPPKKSLNRQGVNEYAPREPKPGIKRKRWGEV